MMFIFLCTPTIAYSREPYLVKRTYDLKTGTGFYVNGYGYLVTNAHVVDTCSFINVKTDDQKKPASAKLMAINNELDVAILKTANNAHPAAPMHSDKNLKKGEKVMIIGYPGKAGLQRNYIFRSGEVVDPDGFTVADRDRYIQFSDISAKGNSGGPLLDDSGNVIGIVTAKMSASSPDWEEDYRVSLAIKMKKVKDFLDRHYVAYNPVFGFIPRSKQSLEQKARDFIVSIHCYHSDR